jgi:type III secretion system chaperone SycN
MDWIRQAIFEFGRSVGLPQLELSAGGRLKLTLGSGGQVGMVHLGELDTPVLVFYRSCALAYQAGAQLRHALRLTDFRHGSPWPLQAAINSGELFLALRLPERHVTTAALEEAMGTLARLHLELQQAR